MVNGDLSEVRVKLLVLCFLVSLLGLRCFFLVLVLVALGFECHVTN